MTPAAFRAARVSLGLTQAEFAEALGLGAPTRISSMENGGTITRQTATMVHALLEIRRLQNAIATGHPPRNSLTDNNPA